MNTCDVCLMLAVRWGRDGTDSSTKNFSHRISANTTSSFWEKRGFNSLKLPWVASSMYSIRCLCSVSGNIHVNLWMLHLWRHDQIAVYRTQRNQMAFSFVVRAERESMMSSKLANRDVAKDEQLTHHVSITTVQVHTSCKRTLSFSKASWIRDLMGNWLPREK
jgi:hypothetical protein